MTTEPLSSEAILRRNVATLELALMQQTERAEAAEADIERYVGINAELATELAKAREQKPAGYVFGDWRGATTISAVKSSYFNTPLYAEPIPAPAPAVPNEIGLGKGEFVIWPVKIGGVHGLAFVKTKDPKAVGTFHAEPEDGQIELGAGDSVIHFGNAESAAVLADRLQHVISLMNPANATPVPAPCCNPPRDVLRNLRTR